MDRRRAGRQLVVARGSPCGLEWMRHGHGAAGVLSGRRHSRGPVGAVDVDARRGQDGDGDDIQGGRGVVVKAAKRVCVRGPES
jgi:hypothetical protein